MITMTRRQLDAQPAQHVMTLLDEQGRAERDLPAVVRVPVRGPRDHNGRPLLLAH